MGGAGDLRGVRRREVGCEWAAPAPGVARADPRGQGRRQPRAAPALAAPLTAEPESAVAASQASLTVAAAAYRPASCLVTSHWQHPRAW